MSLVNDMLKDLDTRRRESLIGKQRLVPPNRGQGQGWLSRHPFVPAVVVFTLTVAGGMGYFWWQDAPQSVSTPVQPVVADSLADEDNSTQSAAVQGLADELRQPEAGQHNNSPLQIAGQSRSGEDAGSSAAATAEAARIAELEQRLAELERQNQLLMHRQSLVAATDDSQSSSSQGAVGAVMERSLPASAGGADRDTADVSGRLLDNSLVSDLVPAAPGGAAATPAAAPVAAGDPGNNLQRRAVELSLEELDRQQVQQALQQWSAGHQLTALQNLDAFAFQHPYAHQSREALAKLLLQQGERERAMQVAEMGLSIAPSHPAYKKVKARLLFEAGQSADALQMLATFPPAVHQDPEYHDLMAAVQLSGGQFTAALTTYENLLQQDSEVGRWWYGLATALESLDRLPDAAAAYERAARQTDLSATLRQHSQVRLQELRTVTSASTD